MTFDGLQTVNTVLNRLSMGNAHEPMSDRNFHGQRPMSSIKRSKGDSV
jgi:hypothetical protein